MSDEQAAVQADGEASSWTMLIDEQYKRWQSEHKWGDDISDERKRELEGYIATWEATPEPERGGRQGPFDLGRDAQGRHRGVELTGADVFWLSVQALASRSNDAVLMGGADSVLRQASGKRDPRNLFLQVAILDMLTLQGANMTCAHLDGAVLAQAHLEGAILIGAQFKLANLQEAHLEGAILGGAHLEGALLDDAHLDGAVMDEAYLDWAHLPKAKLAGVHLQHLQGAVLWEAHLEGADLMDAHLEGADLRGTYLTDANLSGAHLEGADLQDAHLEDANLLFATLERARLREAHLERAHLSHAHLEGAILWEAHLEGTHLEEANLDGAYLRGAVLDAATVLRDARLADVWVADMRWGGANLSFVEWENVPELGDERAAWRWKAGENPGKTPEARASNQAKEEKDRLDAFKAAVRANRQLATTLYDQAMNEDAAKYAERSQRLQRRVLRLQGKRGRAAWSWFLDALAGYGYRPGRTVFWYLTSVGVFAVLYWLASRGYITFGLKPSQFVSLPWYEALVLSVSSFHGRGFFQPVNSLGDPVAILAAMEAVVGLLIEVSFIATFTQRFFGSK